MKVARTCSFVVIAAASLVLVACGGKTSSQATTVGNTGSNTGGNSLVGTVGPSFTITLTQGGSPVKTLKAGAYKINVNDLGTIHNFHLFGPGVDKKTSIPGTGKVTWAVTFTKGSYTYRCDVHFMSGMIGHFTVS